MVRAAMGLSRTVWSVATVCVHDPRLYGRESHRRDLFDHKPIISIERNASRPVLFLPFVHQSTIRSLNALRAWGLLFVVLMADSTLPLGRISDFAAVERILVRPKLCGSPDIGRSRGYGRSARTNADRAHDGPD